MYLDVTCRLLLLNTLNKKVKICNGMDWSGEGMKQVTAGHEIENEVGFCTDVLLLFMRYW